jgi:predicted MFS family arabinose efflux permease
MFSLSRFRHAFRALRHRNFQVFWIGQAISVSGTWMQTTAQSWLLYRLTGSPLALGLLTVAKFGPSLAIAPFAGLVADRWPRRKVLILTQGGSLLVATVLTFLAITGMIRVSHIMLLAFLQGCIDSLDMTVRQTFQMDLVGPEDLQSAVSLNSAAFNSARMVGPPIAGALIAWLGEGPCFALNAISYLAVLISLVTIQVKPSSLRPDRATMLEQISTGMGYVWRTPPVRLVLIAVALTSAVGLSAYTLTPALARDILKTGSQGYGRLLLGVGIGSVLGSLMAAAVSTSRRATLVNFLMLCGQGLGLLGLGMSHTMPAAMLSLTFLGGMASMQLSTCNTYLQTSAPPDLRGRVVSIYVWIFQGLAPLGGFAAGWVAEHAGVPAAILGAGGLCLLAGLALGANWARRQPKAVGPIASP